MKTIGSIIVDDEDWPMVNRYNWRIDNHNNRSTSYARADIKINGKKTTILLHRYLLGIGIGDRREVDHINHNGLDNRRENLRIATRQQQSRNARKWRSKTTSQYKGVCRVQDKWKANGKIDKKTIHIGIFETEEDAAEAYNMWAIRNFGKYAFINNISKCKL